MLSQSLGEYILFCMISFFTISNPLGIMPFYLSLTNGMSQKGKHRVIKRATIASIITLLLFSFLGPLIFKLFGISVSGFRIIGGIIFFNLGYKMLNDSASTKNSKLVRKHQKAESEDSDVDNISLIPLTIPILCGPGIMTNGILLRQSAETTLHVITLILCIIIFYIAVGLILKASERITVWLGETGNKVLSRIMGLILMVIAAEFIIAGVKPILIDAISESLKTLS